MTRVSVECRARSPSAPSCRGATSRRRSLPLSSSSRIFSRPSSGELRVTLHLVPPGSRTCSRPVNPSSTMVWCFGNASLDQQRRDRTARSSSPSPPRRGGMLRAASRALPCRDASVDHFVSRAGARGEPGIAAGLPRNRSKRRPSGPEPGFSDPANDTANLAALVELCDQEHITPYRSTANPSTPSSATMRPAVSPTPGCRRARRRRSSPAEHAGSHRGPTPSSSARETPRSPRRSSESSPVASRRAGCAP